MYISQFCTVLSERLLKRQMETRQPSQEHMYTMTIPHEWRVKSVISPRESKNIVSRERSSCETMFLLSLGEMTDFTRHS